MALKPGKTEVRAVAAVLEPEFKSLTPEQREEVEEVALAALEEAWAQYEKKAKFTVIGQVSSVNGKAILPSDEQATKIALGRYGTENQATAAALGLAYSAQTHETARSWVLPVFHGTPNDWYKARKAKAGEALADLGYREAELKRRTQWFEDHPGEKVPLDWTTVVVSERDVHQCSTCHGIGRVPNDDVPRRADLPRVWY